jgi:putative hydrolase of HD superfamily
MARGARHASPRAFFLEYDMRRLSALVGAALILAGPTAWACGRTTEPADVVQAQVDAYNAHDIEAFLACYGDGITVTDLSGGRPPVRGIPALRAMFASLAHQPPEAHVQILQRSSAGALVVNHERLVGDAAVQGQPEAMTMYEVREGRIVNVWFRAVR